jgi:hypothetical protein
MPYLPHTLRTLREIVLANNPTDRISMTYAGDRWLTFS